MFVPDYIGDFDAWQEAFDFKTDISVRFSETDMFGHVNNVSAFIYFEQARIEYLQSLNLDLKASESVTIVADLQCNYMNQMYFGDTISMHVKVEKVGKSSLDIHYLGKNQDDAICLIGRGSIVNFNPKTNRSEPIPEELIKQLNID